MSEEIPYGYCQCGCGQQTAVISKSSTRRGVTKGDRAKFIKGHTLSTLQRFTTKYTERENGCWEWTGRFHRQGYGFINHEGSSQLAHRVSWQLFHGAIPSGINVLHRCDNTRCVNPKHLFLGTQMDNVHDCMAKNRMNRRGPSSQNAFGAKLDFDKAREIRHLSDTTAMTQRQIADLFGVEQSTIARVIHNKAWRGL